MKLRNYTDRIIVLVQYVAFTPKGGCPLKRARLAHNKRNAELVAFTPKGGCPLKL